MILRWDSVPLDSKHSDSGAGASQETHHLIWPWPCSVQNGSLFFAKPFNWSRWNGEIRRLNTNHLSRLQQKYQGVFFFSFWRGLISDLFSVMGSSSSSSSSSTSGKTNRRTRSEETWKKVLGVRMEDLDHTAAAAVTVFLDELLQNLWCVSAFLPLLCWSRRMVQGRMVEGSSGQGVKVIIIIIKSCLVIKTEGLIEVREWRQ